MPNMSIIVLNIRSLFCVLESDIALASSGDITSLGTKLGSYNMYFFFRLQVLGILYNLLYIIIICEW